MKHRISLCISALCFFTAFLITRSSRTAGEEALAARIAPEILRFHILAESNAAHDQELKIGLKGLVLDYVHSQGAGQRRQGRTDRVAGKQQDQH